MQCKTLLFGFEADENYNRIANLNAYFKKKGELIIPDVR